MNIRNAESICLILLHEHGLVDRGWVFKFDNAKARFGLTSFRKQIISISRPLTELNDEKLVIDTMLHEIAHVLAGPRAGHGPLWKRTARSIGCSATRTSGKETISAPKKYIGVCPAGHKLFRQHAPHGNQSCATCWPTFNHTYLIKWGLNKALETPRPIKR